MVRLFQALALAMLTVLLVLSLDARLAGARADDNLDDCTKGSGDTKIRGCSAIIKSKRLYGIPISKKNLASAYLYRGNAYRKKGLFDHAIADYGKVIKLTPKDANAYNNRGLACEMKGEHDRAFDDFSTAFKLNPKLIEAFVNQLRAYEKARTAQ